MARSHLSPLLNCGRTLIVEADAEGDYPFVVYSDNGDPIADLGFVLSVASPHLHVP